tara:strand:+ start:1282 stop:1737 length:456 start_codon:yes stop_codon:yes gene_type:complete
MIKQITRLIALLIITGSQANAESAGEKARLAFIHWECLTFIQSMTDADAKPYTENLQKHFDKGHTYASDMVAIITSNNELGDDWGETSPLFFRWSLWGPDEDFIVGRLYQASIDVSNDELSKNTDGTYKGESIRRSDAIDLYRSQNCRYLL